MRIEMDTVKEVRTMPKVGLFRRPERYDVWCVVMTITLTNEERAVIQARHLGNVSLHDEQVDAPGFVKAAAAEMGQSCDPITIHVTIDGLTEQPHKRCFDHPLMAQRWTERLQHDILPGMKKLLEEGRTAPAKKTFEL